MRRWTLLLAVLVLPRAAAAQLEEAVWRAPVECPSTDDVFAREGAHPDAVDALRGSHAQVHIDRAPTGGLRARLSLHHRDGSTEARELRAADCDALTEAALLILDMVSEDLQAPSTATEPDPVEEPPPAAVPPSALPVETPPSPAPRESPAPPTIEPATPAPAPRSEMHFGPLGLAGVDRGALPGATLVLSAGAVLWRERLWLEMGASYFVPDRVRIQGAAQTGADLGLATAGVRAMALSLGHTPGRAQARVGGGAGLEVGAAYGRGEGLQPERSGRGLFVALPLTGFVTLGPFRGALPFARLETGPVLKSPTFSIAGQPVHRAQGWLVRCTVGVAWLPTVGEGESNGAQGL